MCNSTTLSSHAVNHVSLPGVTRKQLGLSFLGETTQDFTSAIGDVCLEIEGLDRKVSTMFFYEADYYLTMHLAFAPLRGQII